MKVKFSLFVLIGLGLSACSEDSVTVESSADQLGVKLFNGEDFAGWSHVLVDEVPFDQVWSVEDGVIICQGEPFGYLQTEAAYQDFVLSFEWRWAPGGEPGNSGVLLRINSEPETFMPQCVEAQLKHGSAGDIWAFFGASLEGDEERGRVVEGHEALGDFQGIAKIKDVEKPAGEWNQYEIKLTGEQLTLKINGELVNQAHGLDVVAGPIGFQSEGAEIHFRNIQISEL